MGDVSWYSGTLSRTVFAYLQVQTFNPKRAGGAGIRFLSLLIIIGITIYLQNSTVSLSHWFAFIKNDNHYKGSITL